MDCVKEDDGTLARLFTAAIKNMTDANPLRPKA